MAKTVGGGRLPMGARKSWGRLLGLTSLLMVLLMLAACSTQTPQEEGKALTPQAVATFTLIDANTDSVISVIENNDSYEAPSPTAVNVRLDGVSGSVSFYLDDALVKTENAAPYALFGNNGSDYFPGDLSGIHTVKAQTSQGTFSITFKVSEVVTGDLYVSTTGSDATTNDGKTPAKAFATVDKAITEALKRRGQNLGTVIAVKAGTYRQSVDVDSPVAPSGSLITIKGPGAIISGSKVLPFTPTNTYGATHVYTSWTPLQNSGSTYEASECVFNDGKPLRQKASKATLTQNTFMVDGSKLYINVPALGKVEACVSPTLWKLRQTRNLLVEGLTFQHAASPFGNPAVIAYSGQVYDGVTVKQNGQSGLKLQNNSGANVDTNPNTTATYTNACENSGQTPQCDIIIRNSHFDDNGYSGLIGFGVRNSLIENSTMSRNGWRGFVWWGKYSPDSGNKILHVRGLILRNNTFADNWSPAWWCDTDCMNVRIYDNTFTGNHVGINLELSQGPFEVYRNTFVGNTYSDPQNHPNHGTNTGYDVNCSTTDRCHIHNNTVDGILNIVQDNRCFQFDGNVCKGPPAPYPMHNPFNIADNYYPHSLNFSVKNNGFRQIVFEYTDDCELAVIRTGTLNPTACNGVTNQFLNKNEGVSNAKSVWLNNDNPGPIGPSGSPEGGKKVKLARTGGTTYYSEDGFRSHYNWPDFD